MSLLAVRIRCGNAPLAMRSKLRIGRFQMDRPPARTVMAVVLNRATRPRCRHIDCNGLPCTRPVADGNTFTCRNHKSRERIFAGLQRLCLGCQQPLPAAKYTHSKYCTASCRSQYRNRERRKREKSLPKVAPPGSGPERCPRCGSGPTWLLDPPEPDFICGACGYQSDRPEFSVPGRVTPGQKYARPTREVFAAATQAVWSSGMSRWSEKPADEEVG